MTNLLSDTKSSLSSASNTLSSRATSFLPTLSAVTGVFSNLGTNLGSFISDLGRTSTFSLGGTTDISSLTGGHSQQTTNAARNIKSRRPAQNNQNSQQGTVEAPQHTTIDPAMQTIAHLRKEAQLQRRGPKSVIPVVKQGINPIEPTAGQVEMKGEPRLRRQQPPSKGSAWHFLKR
jgi:hypothetical protein